MSHLLRHKKITVIAAIGLLMAATGAYAFWTQGGTGSGSAATGTAAAALTIVQTSVVAGLAPGAPAQALSGTIANPNSGTVHVTSVTAALSSTGLPAGCTTADYLISNAVSTVNADLASGGSTAWSGPSIQMVDTGANQDACKTASVTVTYTSL